LKIAFGNKSYMKIILKWFILLQLVLNRRDRVIKLLDEYRATCEYKVIEKLNRIKCDCKIEYKNKLKTQSKTIN